MLDDLLSIDLSHHFCHIDSMSEQDSKDIGQMMSTANEPVVSKPKKSKFLWVVLGCVVVGVGLGVAVYQQSVSVPTPTPKPTVRPTPVPLASPITPDTNAVTALPNTMTFPQSGKLRVFSDLNNVTLVITMVINGQTKTITMPNRVVDATKKMNFTDATFDVTAGSIGTINAYLNTTSGPKMSGWVAPSTANKCGVNGGSVNDMTAKLTFVESNLATGSTIFAKQCWADSAVAGDPSSDDFNDFFLAWSYASATTGSPSPSTSPAASASPASSPSSAASASPVASKSPSPTPSPTPTPSASARVVMPDTSEGTPVTGVFEITVGTISVGLILLVLGLFGLLAL